MLTIINALFPEQNYVQIIYIYIDPSDQNQIPPLWKEKSTKNLNIF